ncbi:MAG: 2-methylcitrate dehydratase [Betaproteobacteria bacterium]|nr:2-methylcitrate dehydratase [Betaproteobacteria bacterium]
MAGLTECIARFVADSGAQDFPAEATVKAKKVIADTFACIIAGAGSETAQPLLRYVERAGGTGDRPILGTRVRTSAELAAMVNGTFGHSLDFDDVLTMMPGHPSSIVLASLLASLGPDKSSGRQLIEAYVIGIEVGAKIGLGITNGHYNRGFHGTGTLGIFSAAAALSKHHRLDAEAIRTVLGIAASMASGVRRNFGTMTKPLHTGWAARNAVVAVELARCGFTAAPDTLEAKSGFFAAYGAERSDPNVPCDALGRPYAIVDPGIGLKRFPCYNGSQRAMHGVLQLKHKLGLTADVLARLECRMPPGGMQVLIYPRPRTGLEGKFSLPYVLAAGVLDGAYGVGSFSDEAVNRPAVHALYDKIDVKEDVRCGGYDPLLETRPAGARGFVEVEVNTTDGRSETLRVDVAPGHPKLELGWDDIRHKFLDCAEHGGVDPARAERAFDGLTRLEQCADVNGLAKLLMLD